MTAPQTFILKIALAICLVTGTNAWAKTVDVAKLDIPELHELAAELINFSPDSTLLLLDIAVEKIEGVKNKKQAAKYWAENNLRRADYWIFADQEKANLYLENAFHFYITHPENKKLSEIYCLKAQLAKGIDSRETSVLQKAIPYFDSALVYAYKLGDADMLSFIYYEKAFTLQQMERWQESFENAFLAIENAERAKDSLAMATTYFLMGRMYNYFSFNDYSESYIEKSIAYGKGMERLYSIIHCYADVLFINNKTELAVNNYNRALQICLDKNLYYKAVDIYTNLGQAQFKSGDFEGAEKTFFAMKSINDTLQYKTSNILLFSAHLHHFWGDKNQALKELNTIKENYSNIRIKAFNLDIFKDVADLYEELNDAESAAFFYKKWGGIKDSLQTYTSRVQINELEKMYQNEKVKNQEITKTNTELKASRYQQALMGGVFIILLLAGGGSIYYIRLRALKENQTLKFALKEKQLEQLMDMQESERQRIARELHDGIGQSLAALKMQLQFDDNPMASDITVKRVDELCKEVRTLSHQMMPLVLKENGLKAAVEELIDITFSNSDIEVELVTNGLNNRLPEQVEVQLYRMLQELITNIIKHANATKVGVQLLQRSKNILLIVEDDGKGFPENGKQQGMGFNNINSRIESLSGTLKIQSSQIEGTYVRITVPNLVQEKIQTA